MTSAEGADNIEDIYPATPMQQGMLFHALYDEGAGFYVEQAAFLLDGALDDEALEDAWQTVAARHAALRTTFVWEGVDEPLQVVRRRVRLPFERHDWSDTPEADREHRLESFLAADRARSFDPSSGTLLRLSLLRHAPTAHHLVLTFHHGILDGWSTPILLSEVMALQEAKDRRHTPLPPVRPYRDYVAWIQAQDAQAARRYWKETLAGFRVPTPVPLARHATGSGQGPMGRREELLVHLDEEATGHLVRLARERRITINTVIQGAWALVLGRYAGTDDVVFGATVSGRPASLPGVESMVGLFINTLPARIRLPEGAKVGPWLEEIQARQVEMREFEHQPLFEIKRLTEIAPGSPLFDTLVIFENYPAPTGADASTGPVAREMRSSEKTNYTLTLVAASGSRIPLKVSYDPVRLTKEAAGHILAALVAALRNIAASPESALEDVPLMSAQQQDRILQEWSVSGTREIPEACIHRLIQAQAERDPAALALLTPDTRLTYGELVDRADGLARRLAEHGAGPGTLVALWADGSIDSVVGAVGILMAGAALVPLDPAHPPARHRLVLEDTDARILVVPSGMAVNPLESPGSPVTLVEAGSRGASAGAGPREATPESPAYVIYTSGSTGRPKGVVVGHRSLVNLVGDAAATFGIGPGSRVAQCAAPVFDVSVMETFVALANGATLCLARASGGLVGADLAARLAAYGVTHSMLPVSLLRTIPDPSALPRLEVLCTGGEPVPASLVKPWMGRVRVFNEYGPTETTVCVLRHEITAADGDLPPIGRPIRNVRVYLLDKKGRPVPPGVAGELHVGGIATAHGYLRHSEANAASFLPDPFSGQPGARMYRTGDLARWTPGGAVEFVGRRDDQVKILGYRIEPGEIEAALSTHDAVADVVVVPKEDATGTLRLVAYYVPRGAADASALRNHLVDRLPGHMIPSAFVSLPRLPLSGNGKLDRAALPAPEPARDEATTRHVAPRDDVEESLVAMWQEVLRVDRVGVHDDFFRLGGHSLLATQVASRIRETFGVEITVRAVFRASTIEALAREVTRLVREEIEQEVAGMEPTVPQPAQAVTGRDLA